MESVSPIKQEERAKVLRDYLLGDGSLSAAHRPNCGCNFKCTHGVAQEKWLLHKKRVLEGLGFRCRIYSYECTNGRTDKVHKTVRFYTQNTQELRRLQDSWYEMTERGRRKNLSKMISDVPFDEESFAVWFLDNGCAALKKKYIDYRYNMKIDVEPFLDKFVLSVPYSDCEVAVGKLESVGILSNLSGTGARKHISIVKKNSKAKVIDILKSFCERNGLVDVFSYKYDHPIALSHVERLNGEASKCVNYRKRLREDDAKVWTRLITERENGMPRGRSEEVSPP